MNKISQLARIAKEGSALTSFEGLAHALALAIVNGKLLVGDEELRAGRLARLHQVAGVIAFTGESEAVLVGKLPHALEARPAVDRHEVLGEESNQLLLRVDGVADGVQRRRLAADARLTAGCDKPQIKIGQAQGRIPVDILSTFPQSLRM